MAQGASEDDVRQQVCPSDELEQLCEAVRRKWLGRTGDRMLAEDIAQETALIVLERFAGDGLEDPAKLGAFFHQTARYLHIGAVRQGQRTLATTPDRFDDYATSDRSPEQQLQAAEHRLLINAVLEHIQQERDRDLLTRALVCQQNKPEICEALELSASHYDRVAYRAKQRAANLVRKAL